MTSTGKNPEESGLAEGLRTADLPLDDKDAPSGVAAPFVLVVDDHVDTREAYAEYLRMAGFRIVEAENGVIAIKVAQEQMPDAILLDYAMPMMDGVQAALFLKRDARTRRIPIVMLTAFRDLVHNRGTCDHYLDKPCDPRAVVDKLRSVLGLDGGAA
jgi:CheY-like chemotaxis protein